MNNESQSRLVTIAALLVGIAAAIYCIGLIYQPVISPVLDAIPPFAIAFLLAFLLDPVVDWLQRHRLSRAMGVAVVGLAFLVVFVLVGTLVVPRILDQASGLAADFPKFVSSAQDQFSGFLASHKALLTKLKLPTTTGEWTTRYSAQIAAAGSKSLDLLSGALTAIASRLLWLIIIPMSTFLLLKDLDYIKAKIIHLTPRRHKDRLVSMTSAVGSVFGRYVRGMMVVALMYSVVAAIILSLFGLKYGLIIGAVSGLFYLVPYLGNVVIIGMAVIAMLVQNPASGASAGILALILAVQSMIVFDLFVTPRMAGGSVGVHPVLALFSLALGAQMFGVLGMVLAVPVVASIQVALGQIYPSMYDDLKQHVPKRARRETNAPKSSS